MSSVIKDLFVFLNNKINTNVKDINQRIDSISDSMNPFTMTLSIDKTTAELGQSIESVKLKWTYSKDITTQKLNNEILVNTLREITLNGPYTTNTSFKLECTDKNNKAYSKTVQLSFANGLYYGTSSSTNYNSELISSLTKIITNTKARNVTVNAADNEYIYICMPTRLGTPTFFIGGFEGGLEKMATISFANTYSYSEDYDIYRSDMIGLGDTTITIK